jgi:hypothetical protein
MSNDDGEDDEDFEKTVGSAVGSALTEDIIEADNDGKAARGCLSVGDDNYVLL